MGRAAPEGLWAGGSGVIGRLASAGSPSRDCFVLLALLLCALALVSGCKEDQPPASSDRAGAAVPVRGGVRAERRHARRPGRTRWWSVTMEPTGGAQDRRPRTPVAPRARGRGVSVLHRERVTPYLEHLRRGGRRRAQGAVDLDASSEMRRRSSWRPGAIGCRLRHAGSRRRRDPPGGVRPPAEREAHAAGSDGGVPRTSAGGRWPRTIRPAR